MVSVDRRNLPTGDYSAIITLSSDANSEPVPVFMSVATTNLNTMIASTQWIVLIDANTQQSVAATHATLGAEGYEFAFTEVASGEYYVVVGSDLDNDKYICDGGEACGEYSAHNEMMSVVVSNQDVADIHLSCGFDSTATIPASVRFALPNTGVTRLINLR